MHALTVMSLEIIGVLMTYGACLFKPHPARLAWAVLLTGLVPAITLLGAGSAAAKPAFSCGGFAMLGGAQLACSHIDPEAPSQICTFSWALMGTTGQQIVNGSFLLAPGTSNMTEYQGSGFNYALSNPIVLCQARKAGS